MKPKPKTIHPRPRYRTITVYLHDQHIDTIIRLRTAWGTHSTSAVIRRLIEEAQK